MRQFKISCCLLSAVASALSGQTATPLGITQPLTAVEDSFLSPYVDIKNGSIASLEAGQQLVQALFHQANVAIPAKDFACIIHVVKWADDGTNKVAKSNWYVYNPQSTWQDIDFAATKRLYGVHKPYLLMIHVGAAAIGALPDGYTLAYTYNTVHRLPAPIQHLQTIFSLFSPVTAASVSKTPPPPPNYWALGRLEGNPPADITITGAVIVQGKTINFDTAPPKFDNEGFYRWDISIGVPIKTNKQLQDVVGNNGQTTLAAVDKRNALVLGNLFFKPVDVKADKFLAVPHLVGGVAIESKPLHAVILGIGAGPAIANFYAGVMITTDNLPNHQLDHHYKFAFGLNVPLRTVASSLGIKSQVE